MQPSPVGWPALTQQPYESVSIPELGLRPLFDGYDGKAIATAGQWHAHRAELERAWRKRLGRLPQKPASLDMQCDPAEASEGFTRQLVSFRSADDDRIRAFVMTPGDLKPDEKRPAVVVFHQTTHHTLNEPAGLGTDPSLAIGLHLARRGYVVLCPECYIMKDGGPAKQAQAVARSWPGLTGLGKMTFDASRCVDFLESLPSVDTTRIGCIGFSLGAKETLYALAFEPRYRVGVFNEGGIGLRMSNWTDPWYLTAVMKDHIPAMDHHQVLALCAPRPMLVMGGDDADGDASWPYIHAALPVYRLLGAGDRLGLFNHHGGHAFPRNGREVAYRWLDHWLAHAPTIDTID